MMDYTSAASHVSTTWFKYILNKDIVLKAEYQTALWKYYHREQTEEDYQWPAGW